MRACCRRRERGMFVLAFASVIAMLLTVAVTAFVLTGLAYRRHVQREYVRTQAFWLAESGLELAADHLRADWTPAKFQRRFDDGTVEVAVNVNGRTADVHAEAVIAPPAMPVVRRVIEATYHQPWFGRPVRVSWREVASGGSAR